MPPTVLYEDDVVNAVCEHLGEAGWTIVSKALAIQHGDDIVTTKQGRTLVVEAKGAGSSKTGTKRFGQLFNQNQAKTHVSVAVFRALTTISDDTHLAAIALPDNRHHRVLIAKAQLGLSRAGIGVFWVTEALAVTLDAPWEL